MKFVLPQPAEVDLTIYNNLGQLVKKFNIGTCQRD